MKFFAPTKISENIRETPEGFLLCLNVPITRTGELIYLASEVPLEAGEDGKVIIMREEDDVFNPDTMASFEGKAITINHPNDFVSPTNWQTLARGTLQNIRRGDGENSEMLLGDLLVTDSVAIALVKNGLREVSLGYEAEYVQTGKGRGRQKGIIGNHCALVDKGRAGETCAINDHKGEDSFMSKLEKGLAEKLKALFNKTVDEAASEEKKDEPKKDDAKDGGDLESMKKARDELNKKIDDAEAATKAAAEAAKGKDEAEAGSSPVEERMKAIEGMLTQIMQALSGESEEEEAEEAEEAVGNDSDEEETDDEDAEEKSASVGDADTISRAEILAPGIKASKDIKQKALNTAYGTAEGKKVIDVLTGGKKPVFDSAEKLDTVFVAASELLKSSRKGDLSRARKNNTTDFESENGSGTVMTAEKINELNKAHYGKK